MKPPNPAEGIRLNGKTYRLQIRRNGRREFINLQTADLAEAIRRKRDILALPSSGPKGDLLTDTHRYIDFKVKKGIFSRGSARVTGAALKEFAEAVGGNTADVRLNHLEDHYARLQARVAEPTAQIHMRAIGAFFTWCVDHRPPICVTHPGKVKLGDGVIKPAFTFKKIQNKARQRYCTAPQRDELIADAPTDDLKFILFCGFHTGMRKNEIIEARVNWFDLRDDEPKPKPKTKPLPTKARRAALKALATLGVAVDPNDPRFFPEAAKATGSVHIQNTASFRIKGDAKPRFIPLSDQFREFLRGYLAGKDADGWALKPETKHGKGIYRYDFHAPYNYYLAEKKMRWVTAHVMRHTFASLLAQKGISIYKVAGWLGDGLEVTVDHYAHLAPQDRDLQRAM